MFSHRFIYFCYKCGEVFDEEDHDYIITEMRICPYCDERSILTIEEATDILNTVEGESYIEEVLAS